MEIPDVAKFDQFIVPNGGRVDFVKYIRGFEIFCRANSITGQQKLKDTLLARGGRQLQEIYFLLPGAKSDPDTTEGAKPYDDCVALLLEYFKAQTSKPYEKYLLRKISQESSEDFMSFVQRIRQQVEKCGFASNERNEEEIVDQIIFGTKSDILRAELLKAEVSLEDALSKGRLQEGVVSQLKAFKPQESFGSVNRVGQSNFHFRKRFAKKCADCGKMGHVASDDDCPAKTMKCFKCGEIGHLSFKCANKKRQAPGRNYPAPKKVRLVQATEESEPNFMFMVKAENVYFSGGKEVKVSVGIDGIPVTTVIDSGCPVTIINSRTFEYLSENGLQHSNYVEGCNVNFLGYETHRPAIEIQGSITVDISYGPLVVHEKVFIAPFGRENLLGKRTAEALGVLKVGPGIYNISKKKPFAKINGCKIRISIDDKITPTVVTYRRLPLCVEEEIHKEVQRLEELDIVEKVPTDEITWVSRMLAIEKGDGSYRLVVDMREPNKAVRREYYPQPTIEETLMLPKVAKLSKIDLKKGFYLCELAPECRHITGFATKDGVYRFKRLMFGLKSAPELFNREINKIFANHRGIRKYCDDFLIFGIDQRDHDANLKAVLETIEKMGLEKNDDKCIYDVESVSFLGHIVSTKGVSPDPEKVRAIKSFRAPENKEELQTLLGLATFVSRFVPNISGLTWDLRQLLRKDVDFVWTNVHQRAMLKLKQAISDQKCLSFFDLRRKTIVIADAGPKALGAVLTQEDRGEMVVIAYASKALTPLEQKYYHTEKEALALVWACEKFRIYLLGSVFELWTDCKALTFLFKPESKPCARIERWVLRLQEFTYKVVHTPGKLNIADPLSRLCTEIDTECVAKEDVLIRMVKSTAPTATTPREIEEETMNDVELAAVKKALKTGNWSKVNPDIAYHKKQICQVGELLLRENRIIIPSNLRNRVIESAHTGHVAIEAMKARLRSKVWFPKMGAAVEKKVNNCLGCIMTQLENPPAPLKGRMLPERPWEYVALDFKEALPDGNSLLVAICYFSKFVEIMVMTDTSAEEMIVCLKAMNSRFGNPSRYTVDNGPQFDSDKFRRFCQEANIQIEYTTPYKPNMNGEVERFNRNLKKRIQIAHVEDVDYRTALFDYIQVYHNTKHSAIGTTPASLMLNRELRDNLPSLKKHSVDLLHEEIIEAHDRKKLQAIEKANLKRKAQPDELKVGDSVVAKNHGVKPGYVPRFGPKKFKIVEKEGAKCVILSEDARQLTRDASHLKKIPEESIDMGNFSEEGEDEVMPVQPSSPSQVESHQETETPPPPISSPPGRVTRSMRVRKPPKSHSDFIRY